MATDNDDKSKWWEEAFGKGPDSDARQDPPSSVLKGCLAAVLVGFVALLLLVALLAIGLSNANF
jgi:hypothetical protein